MIVSCGESSDGTLDFTLAETADDESLINGMIAPGTYGSFTITLSVNDKALGARYKISFDNLSQDFPTNLKFTYNGADFDIFNSYISGSMQDGNPDEFTIDWEWDYDAVEEYEYEDTETRVITFRMNVTGEQMYDKVVNNIVENEPEKQNLVVQNLTKEKETPIEQDATPESNWSIVPAIVILFCVLGLIIILALILMNRKRKQIEIYLKDSDYKFPLTGATFELLDEKGNKLEDLEVDEEGYVITKKLAPKKYKILQTSTPYNYVGSDLVYEIDFTEEHMEEERLKHEDDEDWDEDLYILEVFNIHEKGNVFISKGYEAAKENHSFRLYVNDVDSPFEQNELIDTYKLKENGELEINNLWTGEYYILEVDQDENEIDRFNLTIKNNETLRIV